MSANPWLHLWTYLGIFLTAAIVGLAFFGTSRMRSRDPIQTRTDSAFQREHGDDEPDRQPDRDRGDNRQ